MRCMYGKDSIIKKNHLQHWVYVLCAYIAGKNPIKNQNIFQNCEKSF